jgi:hypothetical protein
MHKKLDHQKANGRKWGMHGILTAFSFGKFVVHECNPWRWEEVLPIFRRFRKIAKSDYYVGDSISKLQIQVAT